MQQSDSTLSDNVNHSFVTEKLHNFIDAKTFFHISKNEWSIAPLSFGVPLHQIQVSLYVLRQVDFINDQEVRLSDSWTALSWDFVSSRYIDHIKSEIRQLWTKSCGQVITTTFNHDEVEVRKFLITLTSIHLVKAII